VVQQKSEAAHFKDAQEDNKLDALEKNFAQIQINHPNSTW